MASEVSERKRFHLLFLDSVNETLTGILGKDAAEAFYRHLDDYHSLPQRETYGRLTEFIKALREIFGLPSKTVEKAIARTLYRKLELKFPQLPDYGLREYVEDAILERVKKIKGEGEVVSTTQEMQVAIGFTEQMKPSDHVIMFYSDTEHKHQLLFAYLKAGLDNGEAAAYVSSQESPDQIREAMKAQGIDVEKLERSGALHIFHYVDWYFIGSEFNIARTMGLWRKLYDELMAKGFKGLRVTGEMACFFERNKLDELVLYERALHKVLDIPMTAICAYDIKLVPTEMLRNLIEAHGNAIFLGQENRLVV